VDLYVCAALSAMVKVRLGDMPFSAAVRAKKIRLTGTTALVRCEPEAGLGDRAEFGRLSLLDSFKAAGRGERRAPNLLGIP
jgi:hypothetical protein